MNHGLFDQFADYVLDGDLTTPEDDDLFEELDEDEVEVVANYVVSSPNAGETPWRYTDAERSMLRVHVNED